MQSESRKWPLFFVVATGVFLATLDSSMVNIALPSIMKQYGSSLRATEWVAMVYLLTVTSTLLFWGHLSDRFGRRRLYAGGLAVFGIGSFACAGASALGALVFSRFIQALGAAMMMSSGPAIIREIFPAGQLGRGLGLIGVAAALGLMVGPSLGGVLLEFFSWRALFLVTGPAGLVFAVVARRCLPGYQARPTGGMIDWPGSLAWAMALTCAVLAITHASSPAWSRLKFMLAAGGGFFFLMAFLKAEKVVRHPILPTGLFRQRFFAMAVFSAALSFMVLFTPVFLIPFYLDRVKAMPGSGIGLIMMALPSSLLVVAPPAGWLSDRIGAKFLSTAGMLVSAGSLYLLAGITPDSAGRDIALRLAVLGCGQAMFLSPNSSSVLGRVITEQAGVAGALLATARNFGMLMGIAQAALFFSLFFGRATGGLDLKDFTPAHTASFMESLRATFLITAGFGCCGAFASWRREKWRPAGGGDAVRR